MVHITRICLRKVSAIEDLYSVTYLTGDIIRFLTLAGKLTVNAKYTKQ